MEVRDYECDIEGIVNNANYLHYTEGSSQNVVRHIPLLYKTFTVSNLKEALP